MEPQSIEEVLSLIEERPADADLFQLLGQLYLKASRLEQSRAAYEQSLALAPDDPWTHLYLGNWCFHSGKRREALEWFRRAADLLPQEAIVYTCQGDIHKSQGEHALAEEAFKTAVRIAPIVRSHGGSCRSGTSSGMASRRADQAAKARQTRR